MTDSNDTRTTEQLLAEIEALREQLTAQSAAAKPPASRAPSEPIFSVPMTRREALAGWIAPVVLSMTVAGLAMKPIPAHAAVTSLPTAGGKKGVPTRLPTAVPIPALGVVGLAALGGALAAAGAKLLKDRTGSDSDGSNNGGGSK